MANSPLKRAFPYPGKGFPYKDWSISHRGCFNLYMENDFPSMVFGFPYVEKLNSYVSCSNPYVENGFSHKDYAFSYKDWNNPYKENGFPYMSCNGSHMNCHGSNVKNGGSSEDKGERETYGLNQPHCPAYAINQMLKSFAPILNKMGMYEGKLEPGFMTITNSFDSFVKTQIKPLV